MLASSEHHLPIIIHPENLVSGTIRLPSGGVFFGLQRRWMIDSIRMHMSEHIVIKYEGRTVSYNNQCLGASRRNKMTLSCSNV